MKCFPGGETLISNRNGNSIEIGIILGNGNGKEWE